MRRGFDPMLDCVTCKALTSHTFIEFRKATREKQNKKGVIRGIEEVYGCSKCETQRIWGFTDVKDAKPSDEWSTSMETAWLRDCCRKRLRKDPALVSEFLQNYREAVELRHFDFDGKRMTAVGRLHMVLASQDIAPPGNEANSHAA